MQYQYDYNADGIPDYYLNETATSRTGFYKTTINGKSSVDIDYIESNYENPRKNGKPVFGFTIYADGSSNLPF